MSLPGFEVCLKVDPPTRAWIVAVHVIACLLGLYIIVRLRQPALFTLALGVAWVGMTVIRFLRVREGFGRVAAIWLNDIGIACIVDRNMRQEPVSMMAGSRVLPGIAWFRMATADGRELTELVRASSQTARDWRRLHMLWRLGNSFIGAAGRN